uniref:Uncharacterized protein n=1 Tax=Castor canadensis TaxID=51338 RepID=A0A8C0WHB6_CASCN
MAILTGKNKKGKTFSLTDFLVEDPGIGGGNTYVPKADRWADETYDLAGDVSRTSPNKIKLTIAWEKEKKKILFGSTGV